MTQQEEKFLHLANSIVNLSSSWKILKEVQEHNEFPALANAAFQYALIEYSKPYKYSRGETLNGKGQNNSYKLDNNFVPSEYLELHYRILDARDQLHAHSDLTLLEARVYVRNLEYGKSVNYSRNKIYGTEEIKNIDTIIIMIEETLDSLYKREEELKHELPINSL